MYVVRSLPRRFLVFALAATLWLSLAVAQSTPEPERAIKAPLASKSLLLDVARTDGLLVAVGERGHIVTSTDSGVTWTQADVPTRAMLTGVWFHDRNLGWAVGHDAAILRTKDGGKSWQRVYWDPAAEAPFLDVWFADANRGFAVGAYGRCFVTADGGTTWSEQPVSEENDFHLNQIARAANGKLYIAAESGQVYLSEDAGSTWVALDTTYEGSLFGVFPLEGDSLLAFGLRGHLLRSDDAGATWTHIETGTTAMLNQAVQLTDGTIVLAGLAGSVLVSKDGGRTFLLHQQKNRSGLQALVDVGGGYLVLVGESGVRRARIPELLAGGAEVTR
ncbi:MAG: YCF48-related protein [Thermoanaerobaculia bacterium]